MFKTLFHFNEDPNFIAKNIKIIIFILAILGLLAELTAIFDFGIGSSVIYFIRGFIKTINLTLFHSNLFKYRNFDTGINLNYLNLACYVLLLLGAILYVISKKKETRLIRFSVAIIFIFNVFIFIFALLSPFFHLSKLSFKSLWWIYWIVGRAINLIVIYFTYYVLVNLNKNKQLSVKTRKREGELYGILVDSSKWQRFLHFILDTYICVFIFSGFIRLLNLSFLGSIEQMAGERVAMYVFLLISRFIYYPFFEIILGATPAKLLTESRVVDESGQKPNSKTIVLRTLSRYIPFEAFSFFGERGWHDDFTKTRVVRETKTGVNGSLYWVIVPSFILIAFAIYWGHEKYEDYQSYQYSLNSHNEKIVSIEKRLQNLDTTCIIHVKNIDLPYSSDEMYLKVEEIDKEDLFVSIISMKNYYSKSLLKIEKEYERNKNNLPKVTVKRSDLNKAYTPDYKQAKSDNRNFAELFPGSGRFEIEGIDRIYCPNIQSGGYGSYGDEISISFCNYGWSAKIVKIDAIEGDVKWTHKLPIEAPTVKSSSFPDFNINGTNYTRNEQYKFKMIVEDSLKHIQQYLVEGRNAEKTIKLIE